MRILIIGDSEAAYLAKYHEAFRTGLRQMFDTRMFGQGYPNYDPALKTYPEIVNRIFPDVRPDILIVSVDHIQNQSGFPYAMPFSGLEEVDIPKTIILSDFWNWTEGYQKEYFEFLDRYRISAALCYYPQPGQICAGSSYAGRFVYLPPCFDPKLFNDWGLKKDYDVGFLGGGVAQPDPFYPERAAIHQQLLSDSSLSYLYKAHPGWGNHDPNHPTVGEGFSRVINSCRIFVTTGGKYNCPYPKYIEALASKTVLLAIEPEGASALKLEDGVNYVRIDPQNILEKTHALLADHVRLESIAEKGFQTAMEFHTGAARALDFYRVAKDIISNYQVGILEAKHAAPINATVSNYASQKNLKLHIGSGADYWNGYVNIDIDPSAKADVYMSSIDLDRVFSPGSIDEAVMMHSLNYLTLWQARDFFRMMSRLLAPGGKLIMETVNIENAMRQIRENEGNLPAYIEGVRAFHAFGIDQLERREVHVPNKFSWTPWHLVRELKEAGFSDVTACAPQTHAAWRDMRIEAVVPDTRKSLPIEAARTEKKGKVLFVLDPEMGHVTVHIRGLIFKSMFLESGWIVEFIDIRQVGEQAVVERAKHFNVVYLLKVPFVSLVDELHAHTKAKVVFDLTDALWKPYHRQFGWHDLEKILARVDAVFSENEWICAYGRNYNSHVLSIPACTSVERFDQLRGRVSGRNDGKIRIGWVGSTGNIGALAAIKEPLEVLFARYPHLELRILGCTDNSLIPKFEHVRYTVLPSYNEDTMIEEVLMMDIGLFPPPFDIEDYCVRGALKGMIYMTGGIPAVCQKAGDSARIIQDGVNGMLADTPDEWLEKLDRLIVSSELRQTIGRNALESIRAEHTVQHTFQKLKEALLQVMALDEDISSAKLQAKPATVTYDSVEFTQNQRPGVEHKIRVAVFYDAKGWAWWHRAHQIKNNVSSAIDITILQLDEPFNHNDFDLIMVFDYFTIRHRNWNVPREKIIIGCSNSRLLLETLEQIHRGGYRAGVANCYEAFIKAPDKTDLYCCQNGVDEKLFYPAPVAPTQFSACWVGNSSSTVCNKGLDMVKAACAAAGVPLVTLDRNACTDSDIYSQERIRDDIYHRASVYICASEFEGTPNPALESLACGIPVISTRVGNMPELIRYGYNGFLVERSAAAITEALQMLKQLDWQLLSQNARRSIERGWTWRQQTQKYEQMFKELVLKGSPRTIESGSILQPNL